MCFWSYDPDDRRIRALAHDTFNRVGDGLYDRGITVRHRRRTEFKALVSS